MVAHKLIAAGLNVLMIERGAWVPRGPHNWEMSGMVERSSSYAMDSPYRVLAGGDRRIIGMKACVGGQSVFYAAVSFRFREDDFNVHPEIVTDSNARWPYTYADLEPYYSEAEKILHIAGEAGSDPTEPWRSAPFPQKSKELSPTSRLIAEAATTLGMHPFPLPLAINYGATAVRKSCVGCATCNSFACAIEAKNDLATCVLPNLMQKGLHLKENMVVTKLISARGAIAGVECFDKVAQEIVRLMSKVVVLSAGALGSPHLLLASGLCTDNPGGHLVGRYLMRHCNGVVFGFVPHLTNGSEHFHKELGIHDFYFGHPTIQHPHGKLGNIQQEQTPSGNVIKAIIPKALQIPLLPIAKHLLGLLVIAEDQPQYNNHVTVDGKVSDKYGLPQLQISHRHTARDFAARAALARKAKQILRMAGAKLQYTLGIKTFTHAVGTVRMGNDQKTSALDPFCEFRGVKNLYVADGSFMPTSSAVNPSLTIAANALRVGEYIAQSVFVILLCFLGVMQ